MSNYAWVLEVRPGYEEEYNDLVLKKKMSQKMQEL